jgi:hypothetical protein
VKAVTDGLDQLLSSANDVVSGLADLLTSTLLGDNALSTTGLTEASPAATPTAMPSLPPTG